MKNLTPSKIDKIDRKILGCIKIISNNSSCGIEGKIKYNKRVFSYKIQEVKNEKNKINRCYICKRELGNSTGEFELMIEGFTNKKKHEGINICRECNLCTDEQEIDLKNLQKESSFSSSSIDIFELKHKKVAERGLNRQ